MLRPPLAICVFFLALPVGCATPKPTIDLPPAGVASAADGLRLAYSQTDPGTGETGMLFVHGWCGRREHFAEAMEHFGAERPVAALDLGGHGTSGSGRESWTFDTLAADIVRVLDELGWEEAVLVGHSLGGPLSVLAATQAPERVSAVVAVNALHDVGQKPDGKALRAALPALRANFAGQAEVIVGSLVPSKDTDLRRRLVGDFRRQDPRVAVAILEQYPDFDMAAALAACPVRVTAINGSDKQTKVESNRRYDPDFESQTLDGLGPYLLLEDPERFHGALRAVLPRQ